MDRRVNQKIFRTKEELDHFIENEKDWMFNRIYESIEESWYMGETYAEIFEAIILNFKNDDGTVENKIIIYTSPREEWIRSLELCEKFFAGIEDFEKCQEIKLLREEIGTHGIGIYKENTGNYGN
jgi:hypothetical protein